MIKSLRKKHRLIWIAWAVLVPGGIISAWLVVPDAEPTKLLQDAQAVLLPEIARSKNTATYAINIRSNKEKNQWQLEWKNKKALTIPSAVIYKTTDTTSNLAHDELIGRIEARGSYTFPLLADSSGIGKLHLVLYDFIHENIIERIEL